MKITIKTIIMIYLIPERRSTVHSPERMNARCRVMSSTPSILYILNNQKNQYISYTISLFLDV
jgi:hypothetical protein